MPEVKTSSQSSTAETAKSEDDRKWEEFLAEDAARPLYYRRDHEVANTAVTRVDEDYPPEYKPAECAAFVDHLARKIKELIELEVRIKDTFTDNNPNSKNCYLPKWIPRVGNPHRKIDYLVLAGSVGLELVAAWLFFSGKHPNYVYAMLPAMMGSLTLAPLYYGHKNRSEVINTYFEKINEYRNQVKGLVNQQVRNMAFQVEKELVKQRNEQPSKYNPKVSGPMHFAEALAESKFMNSWNPKGKIMLIEHALACYNDPENPKANTRYLKGEKLGTLQGSYEDGYTYEHAGSSFIYTEY